MPTWDSTSNQYLGSGASAADLSALQASQAAQDALIAAIQTALSPDNATQVELDAAIATIQTALGDKVDQTVYDAMVAANATDAELAVVVAALNEVESELDGLIANLGEVVAIGGRVIPLDDPRPYINNTAAAITLTGNTVADITGDGLELEAEAVNGLASTPIDASAAPVVETLDATTGGGVVRLFTNEDVTNTATLAVQAGEALNGVTDATFLFSNYPAGTQFRADEVTGGWVVSVVGASTDGESPSYAMDITDITATGTSLSLGTNPAESTTVIYNDNTATITRIGDKAFCTLRVASDDDSAIVLTMGSSIVPAGGKILQVSINGFHRWENESQTVVSSGNTITLNRSTAVNADLATELFFITDGWPDLNPQVLAGMVAPEELHRISINTLTDQSVTSDAETVMQFVGANIQHNRGMTIDAATGRVNISQDGDYKISLAGNLKPNGTSGSESYFIRIRKNGVDIASVEGLQDETGGVAISNVQFAVNAISTSSAGDYIDFSVSPNGTQDYVVDSLSVVIEQLPTSTVVMPDALDVEDVRVLLTSAIGVTLNDTIDIGQTWGSLAAEYEFVEIRSRSTGAKNLLFTTSMKTENWQDGTEHAIQTEYSGTAGGWVGATLYGMDIGGTTATFYEEGTNWTTADIEIWGVRPQKTVINVDDFLLTNPDAANGMVLQSNGDGTGTFVYPYGSFFQLFESLPETAALPTNANGGLDILSANTTALPVGKYKMTVGLQHFNLTATTWKTQLEVYFDGVLLDETSNGKTVELASGQANFYARYTAEFYVDVTTAGVKPILLNAASQIANSRVQNVRVELKKVS